MPGAGEEKAVWVTENKPASLRLWNDVPPPVAVHEPGGVISIELVRDAQNPSETPIAEPRRFKAVRPWRMPVGYQVRMTHKFLANTLRGGQRLLVVLKTSVRDHGLDKSVYGKELLRAGQIIDSHLYGDQIQGFINQAFEFNFRAFPKSYISSEYQSGSTGPDSIHQSGGSKPSENH